MKLDKVLRQAEPEFAPVCQTLVISLYRWMYNWIMSPPYCPSGNHTKGQCVSVLKVRVSMLLSKVQCCHKKCVM